MSIKVVVYVPRLSNELLQQIVERFAALGMECQFHPEFALNPHKDSSQIAVRLRMQTSEIPQFQNVEILSGFEISFKDFRYTAPLSVSPATNEKLKACNKAVTIRMHATHTSALRVGLYFAAFLAEATDGIVYMPRSDDYLNPPDALAHIVHEITRYETELPPQDWNVVPFTAWT